MRVRNLRDSLDYVRKEESRVAGPWEHGKVPTLEDINRGNRLRVSDAVKLGDGELRDLSLIQFIQV